MPALLLISMLAAEPAAPAVARAGKPRLVVLDLSATGGASPSDAEGLTEAVVAEVSGRGFFSVISSKEIQAMLGGVLVGFDALSRERAVNRELDNSTMLATRDSYLVEAGLAGTERSVALSFLLGGAAVIALGFFLNPWDGGGPKVALVPTRN